MKSKSILVFVGLILITSISTLGHHAYSGTYELEKTATIKGSIVEFQIRNPHSFVSVDVKDDTGKITRFGIEWGGVTELACTSVTRTTLKVGDSVIIDGAPSRDASMHLLLMRKIVRSDGWSWGEKPGEVLKNSNPGDLSHGAILGGSVSGCNTAGK